MTIQTLQTMLVSESADEARWAEIADYETAMRKVCEQAKEAGAIRVRAFTRLTLENGGDPRDTWLEMLRSGADDTWSGRGNDARRAYFDGVCDEIDRLRRGW